MVPWAKVAGRLRWAKTFLSAQGRCATSKTALLGSGSPTELLMYVLQATRCGFGRKGCGSCWLLASRRTGCLHPMMWLGANFALVRSGSPAKPKGPPTSTRHHLLQQRAAVLTTAKFSHSIGRSRTSLRSPANHFHYLT